MNKTAYFTMIILLCVSVNTLAVGPDCQDGLFLEKNGYTALPKLKKPQREQAKMDKLICIDCRKVFAYDDKIEFKISYEGNENLCVFLGLKVFNDNGWKKYDFNYLGYDEGTLLFLKKNSGVGVYKWARKERPDSEKGGRFMLYAWKLYPDSRGLIKDIHEFTILPKESVNNKQAD